VAEWGTVPGWVAAVGTGAFGEIDPPETGLDWKTAMRLRIVSAPPDAPAPSLGGTGDRVADRPPHRS
jgi:hypothetical protein